MASTCSEHGALEVVDEGFLQVLQESVESGLRLSSQVSGADSSAIWK
jgi:hypothetical protein